MLEELGQPSAPEELGCPQSRHHHQRSVVPASNKDGYMQGGALPREGGLKGSDTRAADCSEEWSSPAHTHLQL